MKNSLPLLFLVSLGTIYRQAVEAMCVMGGDMAFMEGALLRTVGFECINETSFIGDEEYCGDAEGNIDRRNGTYTCPGGKCFQCGPPRRGAALCDVELSDDLCDFPEDYEDEGCFVGENNTVIPVGATPTENSEPSIVFCVNETHYSAQYEVCGQNWFMDYPLGEFKCPDDTPTCMQSEESMTYGCVGTMANNTSDGQQGFSKEFSENSRTADSAAFFSGRVGGSLRLLFTLVIGAMTILSVVTG